MPGTVLELGPYRPPSEAYSLLIRATRNCSWNRCRFCLMYKGSKLELRSVDDIKADIDIAREAYDDIGRMASRQGVSEAQAAEHCLMQPPSGAHYHVANWIHGSGARQVFLQDSNSIIMRTPDLVAVLRHLKERFPQVTRVTSYGRADSVDRKSLDELTEIRQAGLTRLHLGLETGHDPLLELIDKGVTAARAISGGRKVTAAGIELSEYVILGLGGSGMWRQHALDTAAVLNQIEPDFIRVRTLTLRDRMPLKDDVEAGRFVRLSDDEIVAEEKLLLEHLDCRARFVSDHITNLLMEVEGQLPEEKPRMLAAVARYQALSDTDRQNFRVGRRCGVYANLDDMLLPGRHEAAENYVARFSRGADGVPEEVTQRLMERFI